MAKIRVSVYVFESLKRSYAIIEHRDPRILEYYSSLGLKGAEELARKIFHEIVSVKWGAGRMNYRGDEMGFAYLSVETEEEGEYKLEVYPESATLETNTNLFTTLQTARKLMKIPGDLKE